MYSIRQERNNRKQSAQGVHSKRNIAIAVAIVAVLTLVGSFNLVGATPNKDKDNKKVTICHATSSETNPWVRTVVSENAISGHFENNGTTKAGHEGDKLFVGDVECPVEEEPETPPKTCPEGSYEIGRKEDNGDPICKLNPTGCPYGDSIPLGPECDKHKPVETPTTTPVEETVQKYQSFQGK